MGDFKFCNDVIFTDLPNLFFETGVQLSLHARCHHQIIYGELSIRNITPPPYRRRFRYYDSNSIRNSKKNSNVSLGRKYRGSNVS